MTTAYLVMVLDVTVTPPRICGAGIFSEATPTMRDGLVPVVITSYRSMEGYGDARQRLESRLRESEYAWVKPLMAVRRKLFVGAALV